MHCSTKSASVFVAERISPAAASIQLNCICIALHTCTSCTKPITQCYATAQWTHTRSMQQPKAMVTATPKKSHALNGSTPVGIHTVHAEKMKEDCIIMQKIILVLLKAFTCECLHTVDGNLKLTQGCRWS